MVCLDTSLRPGEVLRLRWKNTHFGDRRDAVGYLQVIEGKSKNAKRTLVMLERVAEVLKRRHKDAGAPR